MTDVSELEVRLTEGRFIPDGSGPAPGQGTTTESDTGGQLNVGLERGVSATVEGPSTAGDGESSDEDEVPSIQCFRKITTLRNTCLQHILAHKSVLVYTSWTLVAGLYYVYFGYAMYKTFDTKDEPSLRLLVVTILGTLYGLSRVTRPFHSVCTKAVYQRNLGILKRLSTIVYWVLTITSAVFAVSYISYDAFKNDRKNNLTSALGMAVFGILLFIFSSNPSKINWRPVYWGMALQFYLALLILRWRYGYQVFEWLGTRVSEFLEHSDAGARFVFGEDYAHHFFAFKVMTVGVFFSSIVSVLYYLGTVQFIIKYVARALAFCLGTSPIESMTAASNIFLSMIEAPLLIRPYLGAMTKSELHTMCTSGFATISGSLVAAYILMDVPANHLLSASVMSAPAALAISKLFYPETKKMKVSNLENFSVTPGPERNIIEAAGNGAAISIKFISHVVVNLIAFISILEFLNKSLTWFGHRAGVYEPEEVTFQLICSYLFYPIAWLLGADNTNCGIRKMARLIGLKTFINEFVAYADLSMLIDNTAKYNEYQLLATNLSMSTNTTVLACNRVVLGNGTVLEGGILSDRTIVLATYALCGFSNFGSIGIMLGVMGALAPDRKNDISDVIIRAMIAGNVACFMTACIAGLLYQDGS